MGEHFPVRETLGNFEHTERVWEFYTQKICDWKMGEHFPVRETLGNFEHTERVWEFYTQKI